MKASGARNRPIDRLRLGLAILLLAPTATALGLGIVGQDAEPASPEGAVLGVTAVEDPNTLLLRNLMPSASWQPVPTHRAIALHCPAVDGSIVTQDNTDTVVERSGCPFRIIDGADLLGSPQVAVDPNNPNRLAFFSQHGCSSDKGPHPWSRANNACTAGASGDTHTTFTSLDNGRTWKDQPHGNSGFGEMAAGLFDRDGRLYVAHLFSNRLGGVGEPGQQVFDYHFELYKPQDMDMINYYAEEIQNRAPGNEIEHISMALVAPWTRIETHEQYNETAEACQCAPSSEEDIGNRTIGEDGEVDTSDDIIAVGWHERAYDWENSETGKSSWVGLAFTDTSSRNDWWVPDDAQLIGPCRHTSNIEAWNGRIYVACSADAGYTGRRGANIGDIDIWAFDPSVEGGKKEFISTVRGVSDGHLMIDMNDAGFMAITSTKPVGQAGDYRSINVDVAMGWYGRSWPFSGQAGPALHAAFNNVPFVEARITAMEMTSGDDPTLYMTYMERSKQIDEGDAGLDPNNPTAAQSRTAEYRKLLTSWGPCGEGLSGMMDLRVGQVRHPFEDGIVNNLTGAFSDYRDGLHAALADSGLEHIYLTYGDHGVVNYGQIIGESGSLACSPPGPPILFVAPPPVPVALAGASGLGNGVVAAMTAPAAAMFGYLLVAKRRSALAAVTKAK